MAVVKMNPTIFQIVGFQDSGKTTFLKKLIEELEKVQVSAVTIKHHGHGGKPAFHEEKDSYQHLKAGALAAIVEGEGHLLLQSNRSYWSLDEKIKLLSFFSPNVILIEGHKYESFPKGVIIRKKDDLTLLDKLENIKVVYYWDEKLIESHREIPIPTFSIHDKAGMKWLVEYLRKISE